MSLPSTSSPGFVLDMASLESMRRRARQSPEQSEVEVAQQFEALFVQMMLRSMRDASFRSGLWESGQTRMMEGLHDEQMALQLSQQRGLGLAEVLVQQMQRTREARETAQALADDAGVARPMSLAAPDLGQSALANFTPSAQPQRLYGNRATRVDTAAGFATQAAAVVAQERARPGVAGVLDSIRAGAVEATRRAGELGLHATRSDAPAHVEVFVRRLGSAAERVAQESGLPKRLILAQAALESGWGRQEIRHADGRPSHNLFGIKATGGWRGATAEVMTTEYLEGTRQRMREAFRAYGSYEEGLRDYARLLTENPRYRAVVEARSDVEAARQVQAAGYATDPRYAEKLIAVMRMLPV